MEPVKRRSHNFVYLGPEPDIGDLPVERDTREGVALSHWQPSEEELALLNNGGVVRLAIWAHPIPPVGIGVEGPEDPPDVVDVGS